MDPGPDLGTDPGTDPDTKPGTKPGPGSDAERGRALIGVGYSIRPLIRRAPPALTTRVTRDTFLVGPFRIAHAHGHPTTGPVAEFGPKRGE